MILVGMGTQLGTASPARAGTRPESKGTSNPVNTSLFFQYSRGIFLNRVRDGYTYFSSPRPPTFSRVAPSISARGLYSLFAAFVPAFIVGSARFAAAFARRAARRHRAAFGASQGRVAVKTSNTDKY